MASMSSAVFLVTFFVQGWHCADAWSPAGHERIARVAESLLHGKKKDQIRSLQHADLVDVSTWEVNMTKQFPETAVLHWHHQKPDWTCMSRLGENGHIRCDGHGVEEGSLFCALAYFFEHFAHDKLLQAYPEPKEPIGTPKELAVLQQVGKEYQTSASYLRWLGILIGDLHQPLHWLKEHDYGRRAQLTYKGEKYSLFQFWEEYLPKHLAALPPLEENQAEYIERSEKWKEKNPMELFRDWGTETAEKVCEKVYSYMEVNVADGRHIDPDFELTEELFQKWVKLAQDLTTLAGQRLAFVLVDILEHKRHKDAHKHGRGLLGGHLHHKKHWKENLLMNLGIAMVVEPLLILAFRWHANNANARKPRASV